MEKDSKELHECGVDLIMVYRDGGRYIVIEAKGETGAKSEMENKIIHAIGQIVTKFRKHPNYYHGLAFPDHWKDRLAGKLNYDAVAALNIVVYLVKDNGAVCEIGKQKYRAFVRACNAGK